MNGHGKKGGESALSSPNTQVLMKLDLGPCRKFESKIKHSQAAS